MFDYLRTLFKNYVIGIIQTEINKNHAVLKVKKMSDNAIIPIKTSSLAAGYDLFASESKIVKSRSRELISTDISIEVPNGTYGHIVARSGLSLKNAIDIGAGTIDADYTGTVGVIIINNSNEDFEVEYGMRIAQLICQKIVYPYIEIVERRTTDENNTRRAKGFGSSGIY